MMSNKFNHYLDEAFSHAMAHTTCRKVAVGALFVTKDGKEYYDCNRCPNGGFNCQKEGYCFKSKETGIYESTEATRYACKAIHSEINLIMQLKEKVNLSEGVLFVTRYPCLNCAKHIVEAGIKKVVYGGRQEISDEVKQIFDNAGIKYEWIKECDYEGDGYDPLKWWTTILYENAYEIVKDRKYPVIIPSYNRPDPITIKSLFKNMTEESNYPVYVVVRESQVPDYKKNLDGIPFVNIISFPDEQIDNAGAVRRTIVDWSYDNGYNACFMFDDDITSIGYTVKGYTGAGEIKARVSENNDVTRILAMWQLAMEAAIDQFDVLLSGVMPVFASWKFGYTDPKQSIFLHRGSPYQIVCANVKGMKEKGIVYGDTKDVGHEDVDVIIKILDSDNKICLIPFLAYTARPLSAEFGNFGKTLYERMKAQQEIMYRNHHDKEWVAFRDKRDLPQVVINWVRYRKQKGITKYIFDIWKNGQLLESYK